MLLSPFRFKKLRELKASRTASAANKRVTRCGRSTLGVVPDVWWRPQTARITRYQPLSDLLSDFALMHKLNLAVKTGLVPLDQCFTNNVSAITVREHERVAQVAGLAGHVTPVS